MKLSIGIVGLPNVGKSTLFQALTKKQVDRSNYPFCTIDPNVGVVEVKDERIDKIAELTGAKNKIYATVEFVDIAGLAKDAHKGEGLGNKFLAEIRETTAIVYVLRAFRDKQVVNTQSGINALEEKEILDTEMILKDLEAVEKIIKGLEKQVKNDKQAQKELDILKRAEKILQQGTILFDANLEKEEETIINNYQLLTIKPRIYLLNGHDQEISQEIIEIFKKNNWPYLIIDVLDELEGAEFSAQERVSLGLPFELELNQLITESYKLLDLITFFTMAKQDEVRAWALIKGKTASQAGGTVHGDFEDYFIKAEVINWQDLVYAGSLAVAKEKGIVRAEGREYIVQDGDIVEIKSSKRG